MSDGPSEFSVRCTREPATVTVVGDIDISSSAQLAAAVAAAFDGLPPTVVVYDLTEVAFVDSSGLAVFIDTVNAGHSVKVRGASPILLRVIEATGLSGVLDVEQ